ncbi:glycosyl hydrolase [Dactylonectria macrodidyma]|uniref:Glycosyl hydrolase n=1 Tax=Dactylonectria macrodidyma TaxID=307937 RepID=A0A9P9FN96_9HYPO|nr:glycosyl hydrolase [Dactylonectria macrodidyma]
MLMMTGSKSLLFTTLLLAIQSTSAMTIPSRRTPVASSSSPDSSVSPIKITLNWPTEGMGKRQDAALAPVIDQNFPDPAVLQDADGQWVSFSTSGGGYHIQVATADDPFGPWTVLDQDALPGDGWTSGSNFWAPDVRLLDDGTYIMYFSGQISGSGHCVGTARSDTSIGPYTIDMDEPLICPDAEGGAIDPAGFLDKVTGKRYIVYKVDGNRLGSSTPTPIRLQEVDADDGATLIGDPVTIMDHIESEDGPLVEAPNLVQLDDGRYLLFFSSHMYTDDAYDVKYAVADSIEGPYIRGAEPLLSTPDLGLKGPGGGTSSEDGGVLVFHAYCRSRVRCMYVIGYGIQ